MEKKTWGFNQLYTVVFYDGGEEKGEWIESKSFSSQSDAFKHQREINDGGRAAYVYDRYQLENEGMPTAPPPRWDFAKLKWKEPELKQEKQDDMRINIYDEDFELVELFGKPALFTNSRIDPFALPPGVFAYDLRHDDDGSPVTVEPFVRVNHAGMVIVTEPLDFQERKDEYLNINGSLNFLGESRTLEEFMKDTAQSNNFEPKAVSDETVLFYRNDGKESEIGCIGYLRGDFGRHGDEFHTTWFDQCAELKTQAFKDERNTVIDRLYEGGMLKGRSALSQYCRAHSEAQLDTDRGEAYGFKIETKDHSYYIRGVIMQGDYDFYCMCYDRERLENYLDSVRQEQSDENRGMSMEGM